MTPHTSNSCPCHPEAKVILTYASGHIGKPIRAGSMRWTRKGEPFDITGYEVVSLPDEVKG